MPSLGVWETENPCFGLSAGESVSLTRVSSFLSSVSLGGGKSTHLMGVVRFTWKHTSCGV